MFDTDHSLSLSLSLSFLFLVFHLFLKKPSCRLSHAMTVRVSGQLNGHVLSPTVVHFKWWQTMAGQKSSHSLARLIGWYCQSNCHQYHVCFVFFCYFVLFIFIMKSANRYWSQTSWLVFLVGWHFDFDLDKFLIALGESDWYRPWLFDINLSCMYKRWEARNQIRG